jgi:hypothetical protein
MRAVERLVDAGFYDRESSGVQTEPLIVICAR